MILFWLKCFIVLLLFSFIATSCTVEKRVSRPGWHVEWKPKDRSYRKVKSEKVVENKTCSNSTLATSKSPIQEKIPAEISLNLNELSANASSESLSIVLKERHWDFSKSSNQDQSNRNQGYEKIEPEDSDEEFDEDQTFEFFGLFGFMLRISGLVAPTAPVTIALCGIGFILCFIGSIRTSSNPEEYSGKGFSTAGIIISAIGIGLILMITG